MWLTWSLWSYDLYGLTWASGRCWKIKGKCGKMKGHPLPLHLLAHSFPPLMEEEEESSSSIYICPSKIKQRDGTCCVEGWERVRPISERSLCKVRPCAQDCKRIEEHSRLVCPISQEGFGLWTMKSFPILWSFFRQQVLPAPIADLREIAVSIYSFRVYCFSCLELSI